MSEESQHDGSKKSPSLAASSEACLPEECGTETDTSPYSSQTNIPQQMTTSSELPESNKWMCELCTYENFPLSRKCTMCCTPKPSLGEDIFKLQDGASALPTEEVCEAEAIAERLKPLRISSPQGQASASSVIKWACATCTYENWPRSTKCAMCGATQPSSSVRPPLDINDVCVSVKQSELEEADEVESGARRKRRTPDWLWLQACMGVVEDDLRCVEAYLSAGGDPARALQPHELPLLDRASAFDAGHTLVHLAIRFRRQRILSALLARISGPPALKRAPSHVAPDLAAALRRRLAAALRAAPPPFPCRYLDELPAFALPAALRALPRPARHALLAELTDRDAARALAADPALSPRGRAPARLLPLWNRSAGDCLPDALCQAAYGVSDRANCLRAALADTLRARAAAAALYARWAAYERRAAAALHYAPDDAQLRAEWARLAAAAARPGAALRPLHVFALAHVLRRPLLVYGADVVASHRGEALGYACFRGVYLPLLWEPAFCSDSPLCLAYSRGHFSALVPVEARAGDGGAGSRPLADGAGALLPVHYLSAAEAADEEGALRRWLRVEARGGAPAAVVRAAPRDLLQAQLLEEWLNYYRRLAQQQAAPPYGGPFPDYSSDADTDDE